MIAFKNIVPRTFGFHIILYWTIHYSPSLHIPTHYIPPIKMLAPGFTAWAVYCSSPSLVILWVVLGGSRTGGPWTSALKSSYACIIGYIKNL